jgi:hypothetical protein
MALRAFREICSSRADACLADLSGSDEGIPSGGMLRQGLSKLVRLVRIPHRCDAGEIHHGVCDSRCNAQAAWAVTAWQSRQTYGPLGLRAGAPVETTKERET